MLTVLIADSNSVERRYLEKFFQKNNRVYNVIGAVETRKQLLFAAGQIRPDILLLDTEFDQGNWEPIAISMRRLFPGLDIILNSLYPDFGAAQKAIGLGISGYLLKPADEKSLTEILNQIETFSHPSSPSMHFPAQHDAYPFGAELRLIRSLAQKDREMFLDESAQYLFSLETAFRGQDFRFYICHLFLSLRWLLEHNGIAPLRLAVIDTDLHIRNITMAPHFQAIKDGIQHYFDIMAQLMVPAKEIQTDCADLVIRYVEENFQTKITLEDLANRFHFSAAHIARCLKRSLGKTLNDHVNELRINKATELLTQTRMPIAKIAHAAGYPNVSHFNRVFRNKTAMTPSEMRRRLPDI